MISCPAFFKSLSTLHSVSIRWIFSRPVACASVDVPTFTVIRTLYPPLPPPPARQMIVVSHYNAFSALLHVFFPLKSRRQNKNRHRSSASSADRIPCRALASRYRPIGSPVSSSTAAVWQ